MANGFDDELDFCSNMYPCKVTLNGMTFSSSESLFQACKCTTFEQMEQFTTLDGKEAKKLGHEIKKRKDWEQIKDLVMVNVVKAKFEQNPELAKRLIETGNKPLVEHNYWGDTYWGVCNGIGKNVLGNILMGTRSRLRIGYKSNIE